MACDLLYELDRLPEEGGKVRARKATVAGGSMVRAALVLAALGYDVAVHAAVGDDFAGDFVRREIARAGATLVTTPAAATTLSSVFVGELDRTIVSTPRDSAAVNFAPEPVELLVSDGSALESFSAGAALAGLAALDAGNSSFIEAARVIGQGHARVVTGHAELLLDAYGTQKPADLAKQMMAFGTKLVVFTDGNGPVKAFSPDGDWEIEPAATVAVDVAGCGDVFHAALSGAIGLGYDISVALEAACEWATRHAGVLGNSELSSLPKALER